jgi:hypothetical protein
MKIFVVLWFALAGMLCGAGLTFPEPLKEISAGVEATTVTAEFDFKNETAEPVSLTKIDGGCACMSVKTSGGQMKFEPGESGKIQAVFEVGNFSGTVDKVIGLWLAGNSSDEPSQQLTVRVHIPVLVTLEPKTLKWPYQSEPVTQKIQIRMSGPKPIKILSVSSASKIFKYELKTVEEGSHYELSITPDHTTTPGLAVFRIETDSDSPKHKIQQVFAVIPRAGKP